jgi:ketosteroid isomerase-like protein
MDDVPATALGLVRAYYRAIDGASEVRLADLLAPEFHQERSDRTFQGRDAFLQFMREDRPDPDTTHELRACFEVAEGGDRDAAESETERTGQERVAVQGRVRRSDGTPWFEFVDVFTVSDGRIERLETYSR